MARGRCFDLTEEDGPGPQPPAAAVRPVLYSFRRCPYAMRARMAIGVAGCEVEHREILLKDRPAHLREISAAATVPCLQIEPGRVLTQSMEIMSWAVEQNDPLRWAPSGHLRAITEELVDCNDGEFKFNLDRFKYPDRYDSPDPDAARTRSEAFVARLDGMLREHAQLLGEEVSIADVALFPFIRQFSRVDEAWFASTSYDAVRRWLEWWESSPIFTRIMRKIPVWHPGDPALPFSSAYPR